IAFDHVSFTYPGSTLPALHDVDLTVSPGETVALVGASGSGKSTLASLVPRFFDPEKGRVLVDGHDVRHVTLPSLRGQIGVVLDDPLSSVDVRTEAEIEANLRALLAGHTALLIAHRASTVAMADRVVLIEDGRVTATGRHADLLVTNPAYRRVLAAELELEE